MGVVGEGWWGGEGGCVGKVRLGQKQLGGRGKLEGGGEGMGHGRQAVRQCPEPPTK